ncbi:MAG: flavin reductase family protein [Bacteroidota bacterium]
MLSIDPKNFPTPQLVAYLQGSVAPRPIAFASTVDEEGNPNLSPFSFFNLFSTNPAILIFSPSRRVRDNTTKHSLQNVLATKEVVINMVNYDMVQQTSLASTEYPLGMSEFTKSGFTPLASDLVRPFRVKESPVQFECKVNEVIALGSEGGAGNLVICEVLRMHVDENILSADGKSIDQQKIRLVSRLGGNWYSKAFGESLFEVEKPLTTLGIGVDHIPADIRNSKVLTGNNLGQLGNVEHLPDETEVNEFKLTELSEIFLAFQDNAATLEEKLHEKAKELLDNGRVSEAWKTLLAFNN